MARDIMATVYNELASAILEGDKAKLARLLKTRNRFRSHLKPRESLWYEAASLMEYNHMDASLTLLSDAKPTVDDYDLLLLPFKALFKHGTAQHLEKFFSIIDTLDKPEILEKLRKQDSLTQAVEANRADLTRYVLERGADITSPIRKEEYRGVGSYFMRKFEPVEYAFEFGTVEVANVLLEYGALERGDQLDVEDLSYLVLSRSDDPNKKRRKKLFELLNKWRVRKIRRVNQFARGDIVDFDELKARNIEFKKTEEGSIFHYFAYADNIKFIIDLALENPDHKITYEDLTRPDRHGNRVIDIAGDRNQLALLDNSKLWHGRSAEFLKLRDVVSPVYRSQLGGKWAYAKQAEQALLKALNQTKSNKPWLKRRKFGR